MRGSRREGRGGHFHYLPSCTPPHYSCNSVNIYRSTTYQRWTGEGPPPVGRTALRDFLGRRLPGTTGAPLFQQKSGERDNGSAACQHLSSFFQTLTCRCRRKYRQEGGRIPLRTHMRTRTYHTLPHAAPPTTPVLGLGRDRLGIPA